MNNTSKFKFLALLICLLNAKYSLSQNYNWSEHIAPILYNNCTNCHIDGGIAPFSLVGYSKAKNYSSGIVASTQNRTMPPWPADPNYRRYAHERILSSEEIHQINVWANNGCPEGDISKAPADPKPQNSFQMAQPSMSLKMPDYLVNTTSDEYRCFVLPTNSTVDNFLTEIEVVPGNRKIVHHVLVFHDTSDIPFKKDINDPKPGYLSFGGTGSNTSQLIGLYVPGQEPYKYPTGLGVKLLKKGYIILQIHYPGYVENQIDSTKVLLKTTTQPMRSMIIAPVVNHSAQYLTNGPLYIPADQTKTFYSKYSLNNTFTLYAVAPHMHLIGKSIKAYNINGKDTNPIVNIPSWDFHWQRTYVMRKPLILLKNSTIWGEGHYDNTAQNPLNPNTPPQAIGLGEGTKDEMMQVYFWLSGYQPGDENMIIDGTELKNISKTVITKTINYTLFPNPSSDIIQLQSQNPCIQYSIYDHNGRLVKHGIPSTTDNLTQVLIDVKDIPSGCYQLSIKFADGRTASSKFIHN